MKVLFTCVVGHGRFNPMVPLAHALQAVPDPSVVVPMPEALVQ